CRRPKRTGVARASSVWGGRRSSRRLGCEGGREHSGFGLPKVCVPHVGFVPQCPITERPGGTASNARIKHPDTSAVPRDLNPAPLITVCIGTIFPRIHPHQSMH